METSRTLTLTFRWSLFVAVLAGIFWGIWALTGAAIPVADPAQMLVGGDLTLAAIASRAWDPLGLAILTAFAIVFSDFIDRNEYSHRPLGAIVGISGILGFFLGEILTMVWCSSGTGAPWMPVVLLGLAAVLGLVLGLIGVFDEETSREMLAAAFLAPPAFMLGASAIGGIADGFLFTLVVASALGLAGSLVASTLCFLTLAILKNGFWSRLGAWLSAAKPVAGATAPAAPDIAVQSRAARIEAITTQIATLEVERDELQRHPDSARL